MKTYFAGMALLLGVGAAGASAQDVSTDHITDLLIQKNSVDARIDEIGLYSDSGAEFPTYAKLTAHLQDLAQRHADLAQFVSYGKTLGGRPLVLLKIESKAADLSRPGRPAIEISGAIHGNEYLGIEEQMVTEFLEHPDQYPGLKLFLAAGGAIYFIPVVNPDGFEGRVRTNNHGKDLNRDWDVPPTGQKFFKEPESLALAKYLDADLAQNQLKYVLSVDYHCCLGALITPWTYTNAYPSQKDLLRYNTFAQIQKDTLGFQVGNAMDTVGYNAVGGTLDYFFGRYNTLAFAIEGRYGDEAKHLDEHLKFFDGAFQKVATASLFGE